MVQRQGKMPSNRWDTALIYQQHAPSGGSSSHSTSASAQGDRMVGAEATASTNASSAAAAATLSQQMHILRPQQLVLETTHCKVARALMLAEVHGHTGALEWLQGGGTSGNQKGCRVRRVTR